MRRLERHFGAVIGFVAFALFFTGPVWRAPSRLLPGEPTSDLADHAWGYWWVARSLAGGSFPWYDRFSHFPPGGVHLFPDLLGALCSAPLQWAFGLCAAFNLVAAANLVFAALAAYALGMAWTGSRASAFVCGTVFAFSPYALSNLHNGTTEYALTGFLPLFLLALEPALEDGKAGAIAATILAWWASTLAALYYGLFTGIILVLVLVSRLPGLEPVARWRLLRRAGVLVAGYAVLAVPWAVLFWWSLHAPNAVVNQANAPGWNFGALPVTDLLTFFAPFHYHFPDMAALGNRGIEHDNSLGYVALALALFALVRVPAARKWRPVAAGYGILLLGPQLTIWGHRLEMGGFPVLLPYGWLCFPGSPLRLVHHPFRLVVWAMLLLGGLAALGLSRIVQRLEAPQRGALAVLIALAVVVESSMASPARFPIPVTPLEPPPVYATLATVPGGAVLDFPPRAMDLNRRYLLLATAHGRPVPYGTNIFMAPAVLDNPLVQALLGMLSDLASRTTGREGPLPVQIRRIDPEEASAGARSLAELGYERILLHTREIEPRDRARVQALLERAAGPGERWTDELRMYRLRGGEDATR